MRAKSAAEKDIAPRIVCKSPWRVSKVKPLADYKLSVEFLDGTQGIVDLKLGANVRPENQKSRHVLEKSGMSFSRVSTYNGVEVQYYEIARNDFSIPLPW